jgi:flagellar biosynthesis protein FlhA
MKQKSVLQFDLNSLTKFVSGSSRHADIFFALGILGIIAVLIFPIPTWLMDFLLCISISVAVLILMTVLFISKPLEFNSFPSILLVVTMLRLALNISSTRLILANGHKGADAAGYVIEAFGNFVMQNSVVIGVIVFIILTIINFVVITKGSGRIAEVAARFSLDAMPGKQMAIDADLSAGLIDEPTAKKRRKELEEESTFYGAMDGANKFVRGDAIAGILIILINFIAGMIIGIVQKKMGVESAIKTYTILTIGDGLVAQVPALIVSIAAGLLVTKSGSVGSTEKDILKQLGSYPHALGITSALLVFMAMMPALPALPFLTSAAITGALAYNIRHKEGPSGLDPSMQGPGGQLAPGGQAPQTKEEIIEEVLAIDAIKIELGYELLPLLTNYRGTKITDQIKALRKTIAKDLGFVLPSVRIQDNVQLEPNKYVIKIKDIECASGKVKPYMFLIMNPTGAEIEMPGESTIEPAFGLKAKWIDEAFKEEALFKEYTVVDAPTVITTHLTEIIKDNITELLSYSETQKLLDGLGPEHKKLAQDIIPDKITVTGIQRVLQGLLSEGISIRDLATILEAVSEIASEKVNVMQIVEHVRVRLAKQICHNYTADSGYIPLIVLTPQWEQTFLESLMTVGSEKQLSLAPSKLQEFVSVINREFEKHVMNGIIPILLTSPTIRPYVRSLVERFRATIHVISQNEIHPKAKIKTIGRI